MTTVELRRFKWKPAKWNGETTGSLGRVWLGADGAIESFMPHVRIEAKTESDLMQEVEFWRNELAALDSRPVMDYDELIAADRNRHKSNSPGQWVADTQSMSMRKLA